MMDKTYNPKDIEQPIYNWWEQQGYFKPNNNTNQDSYCIMIPPPNITGRLHMGHAFQQTIMDILIRYQRMQGKNTLWQAGIDHAGIATQMIVEQKIIAEEGKNKYDYNREIFINKVWQWKTKYGYLISNQMRRLGNSLDWERERFTMDDKLSDAVKEVFVRLYQENLIYRGKRLVNWDPKLRTAISDLEVKNREYKGYMWYLRYPIADDKRTITGLNYLVVATTRPETVLGDTGIAVNPNDIRYRNLIGQCVILPLVGRRIPIVGDEQTDMSKGTGCVKITPAHDFNDYKLGQRHTLPMINIMTLDGKIRQDSEIFDSFGKRNNILSNNIPTKIRGLERFSAREVIVDELNRLGLLEEIKPHIFMIPYNDRSGVIIEPMLTNQWYIRTTSLAKAAIDAVKQKKIQFVPKQYENMYFSWMRDIQDWCISRQLWWGHRIPAWYDTKGQVYVGRSEIEIRLKYNLTDNVILIQDEDVLDTWFSSGLWTFSTLGWPNNTDALRIFHPTNVIVSGFDIIFFWIARMIMLTMHFIKDKDGKPQVPFKTVYITGLIRDEEGQKMSKSKGNIIDPIDIIDGVSLTDLIQKRTSNMMQPQITEKIIRRTKQQFPNGIKSYGTDALRFTLAAIASTSRDINWDIKRLEGYRNFCNKLWNASRFVLMNTKDQDCGFNDDKKTLSLADRWIITEFNQTVKEFRTALDNYRFDLATSILYEFTWNQFCDWYLELTKPIISNGNDSELRGTRNTLVTILEALLRLAHPIIPFITETIWQKVKIILGKGDNDTIMLQSFPIYDATIIDIDALNDLNWIKQTVMAVRNIRASMNISHNKPLEVLLRKTSPIVAHRMKRSLVFILHLARLNSIKILPDNNIDSISIFLVQIVDGAELIIPITADLIDKDKELERIAKETEHISAEINRINKNLKNKNFIQRAPEKIIIKEQEKLKIYKQSKEKLLHQKHIIERL